MSKERDVERKAKLLGVEAYPHGREWRCSSGHVYPPGYGWDRCPIDGKPLTRVGMELRLGDPPSA